MVPVLDDAVLDSISRALGDAMIGSDISRVLAACDIADTSGESTKWKRLYYTFRDRQRQDKCANRVCQFVEAALKPARWSARPDGHRNVRNAVNVALLTAGLQAGEDGKIRVVSPAVTLDEARLRASRLRTLLDQRQVHSEVLRFCSDLLLRDQNYFHAVFETTKSIADRLRKMAHVETDGNKLVDDTLEKGHRPFPLIALNRYDSPSLVNEQTGFAHLTRGLFFAFRNVTAHEPEIIWQINEADALDMMTTASLIHRRLDTAQVTIAFQPGA